MTQKLKQIIIVVIVIVVAFVAFKVFFGPTDTGSTSLVADKAGAPTVADGQAILATLNRLNAVVLDEAIFTNNVFLSLKSFERPLESQIPGRPNPFAQIGSDGSLIILHQSATSTGIKR